MTSKEQSIKVLMLIGTLISYVKHGETTRKIDRLRKHVRKGLQALYNANPSDYDRIAKEADIVWAGAKHELDDMNYTISLIATCRALWSMLDGSPYQQLWFTERTFTAAMQSMEGVTTRQDTYEVERDSNMLTDIFGRLLGVEKKRSLRVLSAQIKLKQKESVYVQ
ncbi:hypothetical protein WCX49_11905 [Sulfurimonas sp. HSL-1656]|uniref:hypothetical protein n=1 Tax=Thiomicrolovo subterrani TaxID=3131934 RepID=UPI0031F87141